MAKIGRPKKPKADLLNVPLRVMTSAEQRELLARAAALDGMEVSTWARKLLLEIAERRIDKAAKR